MQNIVVCPTCKTEIDISKTLHDQIVLEVSKEEQVKFEQTLREERQKTEKKVKEEMELKLKEVAQEKELDKKRIDKLMQDALQTRETMNEMKIKEEERELENQKKLQFEREKIKEDVTKLIQEKAGLEVAELRKKLEDTQKSLDEARKKSEQGSQQLQGEVLELQLEQSLTNAFPDDTIESVQKGIKGADIRQIVKTQRGNVCGVILWELKRTKQWSDDWIGKLKQDARAEKAHIPVIVSETLPLEAKSGFGMKEGVIICSLALALPISEIMRQQLISVARERFILEHKSNKTEAEQLFEYVTSHEFLQQIESLVEIHRDMQEQITKERAAFEKIWKAREVQTQKILKTTTAIAGSLQGIVGNSLPQIKGLELDSGEDK